MTRPTIRVPKTPLIYLGGVLRVRWMRYRGDFPAKSFLVQYPDDMAEFLWRAHEIGDTGTIALRSEGHQLKGRYSDLHQFNMSLTRSWGFRDGSVYVVLYAETKKKPKEQERDYKRALLLRDDYTTGNLDD